MTETNTNRGFQVLEFTDEYEKKCILQQSSIWLDGNDPGASCIWLGLEDADPMCMAVDARKCGVKTNQIVGWVPYPVPEEVKFSTKMHLSRKQVAELIVKLQLWLDTGRLHE